MSAPRKAIFAISQSEARHVAAAFGLSPEEWSSFGFGAAIAGRQFDRIVAMLPVNPTADQTAAILERIRTRISPQGTFTILPPTINGPEVTRRAPYPDETGFYEE